MGYDTSDAPPRPWFCGHVYLKKAKRLIDSISAEVLTINDVTIIISARLNIMRGIRVAVQLLPEDYNADDILMEGLEGRIAPERLQHLVKVYRREFRFSVSGTGQYGVPNFDIRDRMNPKKLFSAIEPDSAAIVSELGAERLAAVNDLMDAAIDIFLGMYMYR